MTDLSTSLRTGAAGLAGLFLMTLFLGVPRGVAEENAPTLRRRPTPNAQPTPLPKEDERWREAILMLGSNSSDDKVRALATLSRYKGNPEVVPIVLETYRNSTEWNVKAAAITAMGELQDESYFGEVARAMMEAEDYRVRLAATRVPTRWEGGDWQTALLRAVTFEKNEAVTQQILESIEAIGIDFFAIIDVSMRTRGPENKLVTADILTRMQDPRAIPTIADFVQDPDPVIRRKMVYALGEIGTPEVVPHLIRALPDRDRETRYTALTSLSVIGDRRCQQALIKVLQDHYDVEMRQRAATELGNLKSRDAVPALKALMGHTNTDLRHRVTTALGQIGDLSVIPDLRRVVNEDDDIEDKVNAISALGLIGGNQAIQIARDALDHPNPSVRSIAASILGQLGDDGSIDLLLKRLTDQNLYVQIAAIEALGLIGNPRVLPQLEAKLEGRTPVELDAAVFKAQERIAAAQDN